MPNYAKYPLHFVRSLSRSGKSIQVTIPRAILRASDFKDEQLVVIHNPEPDVIVIKTLTRWVRDGKPGEQANDERARLKRTARTDARPQ